MHVTLQVKNNQPKFQLKLNWKLQSEPYESTVHTFLQCKYPFVHIEQRIYTIQYSQRRVKAEISESPKGITLNACNLASHEQSTKISLKN